MYGLQRLCVYQSTCIEYLENKSTMLLKPKCQCGHRTTIEAIFPFSLIQALDQNPSVFTNLSHKVSTNTGTMFELGSKLLTSLELRKLELRGE
jgi:hypothetical protein